MNVIVGKMVPVVEPVLPGQKLLKSRSSIDIREVCIFGSLDKDKNRSGLVAFTASVHPMQGYHSLLGQFIRSSMTFI